MKSILSNKYFLVLSQLVLGAVFIVAAIGKIAEPAKFATEISKYNLLPEVMLNVMALSLPWIELICGILLIFGNKIKANSAILGIMLVVFTIGVISAFARGLDINCGCFGGAVQQKVGWEKILENTGLILLSVNLFIFGDKKTLSN